MSCPGWWGGGGGGVGGVEVMVDNEGGTGAFNFYFTRSADRDTASRSCAVSPVPGVKSGAGT